MTKRYSLTPKKLKTEILSAIDNSGSTIAKMARDHKIPAGRIYSWRRLQKKKQNNKISDNSVTNDNQFIELSLEKNQATHPVLKKASLEFDEFSLLIEGKFSTKKVIQLMKVLEVS